MTLTALLHRLLRSNPNIVKIRYPSHVRFYKARKAVLEDLRLAGFSENEIKQISKDINSVGERKNIVYQSARKHTNKMIYQFGV